MKHAVILNVGEGDDIQLVAMFDCPIKAMGYAKTAAKEIQQDMMDESFFRYDWVMPITETLVIYDDSNEYLFTVDLQTNMVWTVRPFNG